MFAIILMENEIPIGCLIHPGPHSEAVAQTIMYADEFLGKPLMDMAVEGSDIEKHVGMGGKLINENRAIILLEAVRLGGD